MATADLQQPAASGQVETIEFETGHRARLLHAGPRRVGVELLQALEMAPPRPVLLVVGGADKLDPEVARKVEVLIERAVVPAAEEVGAAVLDGGTQSGVMAAVGEAVAAAGHSVDLIGVAPAGRVTYPGDKRAEPGRTQLEPHHSHFVLASSDEWGGETDLLLDLLDSLRGPRPAAVLVAGGGAVTRDELIGAARRGIPIVVLGGSAGAAAELGIAATDGARKGSSHAVLEQVAQQTDVHVIPIDAEASDLERRLHRLLQDDATLLDAWRQQAVLSRTASAHQRSFQRQQLLILGLGVAATTLVVVQAFARQTGLDDASALANGLRYAIVLVPIALATFVAASARWRPGGRWVLLRGAAEALKSEIYRYRVRAGRYARERTRTAPAEVKLAEAVGSTMGALMRTDISAVALEEAGPRQPASGDDGHGRLTPDQYVEVRMGTQIGWYRRKVRERSRRVQLMRWAIIAFGTLGTLLAAFGAELWVAVTVAVAGAVGSYLEMLQLETTITLYNQAATDLEAIRRWWTSLPAAEQLSQRSVDRLVERAEQVMQAEHAGWVRSMQDAMTRLRLEQSEATREQAATERSGD
jgi:hypothetical protein